MTWSNVRQWNINAARVMPAIKNNSTASATAKGSETNSRFSVADEDTANFDPDPCVS